MLSNYILGMAAPHHDKLSLPFSPHKITHQQLIIYSASHVVWYRSTPGGGSLKQSQANDLVSFVRFSAAIACGISEITQLEPIVHTQYMVHIEFLNGGSLRFVGYEVVLGSEMGVYGEFGNSYSLYVRDTTSRQTQQVKSLLKQWCKTY